MDTPAERAPAESPSSLTGLSGLFAVFFFPGELFEQLRREPVFWIALMVGASITALSSALIPTDLMIETLREAGTEIPADAPMAGAVKWLGVVGGIIGYLVLACVIAALLTLAFGFILGDDASFRQYLGVASHAMLIPAVGYLLLTPLRIVQGDVELTFNARTFLPFVEEGYVARLLSGLELFTVWSWIVMGLGVSVLARERSWASGATIVVSIGVAAVALFALVPR